MGMRPFSHCSFLPWELSAELTLISLALSDIQTLSLCLAPPTSPMSACMAPGGEGVCWAVGHRSPEFPRDGGDTGGGRSASNPGRAMAAVWHKGQVRSLLPSVVPILGSVHGPLTAPPALCLQEVEQGYSPLPHPTQTPQPLPGQVRAHWVLLM